MEITFLTNRKNRRPEERGFTILQMIITLGIILAVSSFGLFGILNARAEMRVQNSARKFAVFIEKARADSVRRHAGAGQEAVVRTFMPGGNSFSVTMDFDGSGTVQTRTFNLDSGVFFATVGQTAVFDWRGRIPERLAFQVSNGNKSIPVDISGAGDITVDDQIFADDAIPPVTVAQVNGDQLPDPTPVPTATPTPEYPPNGDPTPSPTPTPNGNGNGGGNDGGNGNGGGNPHETPSPTPPPTPEPTPTATPNPEASPTPSPSMQCSSSIDKTNLVLSQSNPATKSGTVTYTIANGSGANGSRTVTAAIVGGSRSLTFSISPSTLNNGGSAVITISSKTGNGNRGTFLVKIGASPACGSEKQVAVTVNN